MKHVLSYLKIILQWSFKGQYPLSLDRMKRLWSVSKVIHEIKREAAKR